MTRSIEDVLGQKIERVRAIPGTRPGEEDKVRYVSYERSQNPAELFKGVVWRVKPPIAKHGGVVLEGCIVTLPDGTSLYSLAYHGDVGGWLNQIERGAKELGLLTAKISSNDLILSNGRCIPLSDCSFQFD